jgi:Cu+-exporting ATPase
MTKHASHRLVTFVVLGDRDESAVLSLAASLALAAGEPLGAAIRDRPDEPAVQLQCVDRYQILAATGLTGFINGHVVVLGDAMHFAELGIPIGDLRDWAERLGQQGQSVTFIAVDGNTAGIFGTRGYGAPKN